MAVHSPSLGHGFMSDDTRLVLENPQITSRAQLARLLATDWFDTGRGDRIGYYRPFVKLTLRATWLGFGARAWAFHAGNVLAHAAAVLFLGLFLSKFLPALPVALGASLFAVHPATVQAVDIVTARSDVLAGALVLASCWIFTSAAESDPPRRGLLLALAATALLAFASKESALLLPAPLLALGLSRGLEPRRLVRLLLPVAAVETLFVVTRMLVVRIAPLPNNLAALGPDGLALGILTAVSSYGKRLVTGLPITRLPPVPTGVDLGVVAGGAILLAAAAVVARKRGRSLATFALVLLFSSLAPALAIWLIHIPRWKDELPLAERWLYLPAAGAAVLAALLLSRLRPRVAGVAGGVLVLAFAATTWERAAMYRSQQGMADYVAAEYVTADPRSLNPRERYFAAKMRAQRDLVAGRIADGLENLLEADRIAPALPDHLPVIAQAELDLGHPDRAAQALERLLSPEFAADSAAEKQREDFGNDTIARFDRAAAWHLLGRARWAAARRAEADAAFSEAARLAAGRPDEAAYLVDLSASLRASGKLGAARTALERAAALRPDWDRPRRERRALDSGSGGGAAPRDRDARDR